jgi:hypothetical protein
MTASDTLKKPVRRVPGAHVVSSLRRVRNKDLPPCGVLPLARRSGTETGQFDLAIDNALANAQKTVTSMATGAVMQDCCADHMALCRLRKLIGSALSLMRRQCQSRLADVL